MYTAMNSKLLEKYVLCGWFTRVILWSYSGQER